MATALSHSPGLGPAHQVAKCEPGPEGRARTPLESQHAGAHGDPHKGAEGNPGGLPEEACRGSQAHPVREGRNLVGGRGALRAAGGRGLTSPSVSPKVSGEYFSVDLWLRRRLARVPSGPPAPPPPPAPEAFGIPRRAACRALPPPSRPCAPHRPPGASSRAGPRSSRSAFCTRCSWPCALTEEDRRPRASLPHPARPEPPVVRLLLPRLCFLPPPPQAERGH